MKSFNLDVLMHLSSAIPWGGTPGKFNVEWGLIRGFERLTYPGGGGNEGGLFSKSLAPRGTGDFANETGQLQVVLNEET